MTTTNRRPDQYSFDAHQQHVEPVPTSLRAMDHPVPKAASPAGDTRPADQDPTDTHNLHVGGTNSSLRASADSTPNQPTSAGDTRPADQAISGTQRRLVGGTNPSPPANVSSTSRCVALEGNQTGDGSAATIRESTPNGTVSLADPFLALAADVLDDTEQTKIANENRLRQLTRTAIDSDGEERGFGLDETHPDVANLAALVNLLGQVEHQAVLQLQRKMRKHPLGPWIKNQKGVGEKQAARLLAVIGDPYLNTLYDRPRTVSELWAYCGLHTLPAGQATGETQKLIVGGEPDLPVDHRSLDTQNSSVGGEPNPAGGNPGHGGTDTHAPYAWVAARRRKGQRANWSSVAKSRAYLIAESMLRAGNREVYDRRKAATDGRLHAVPCVRCGPRGKPAPVGSPWSDGHRHADALRIVSKELLKDLWREAKRLHDETVI